MNLTDEEIRIKVAEAMGLKFIPAGRIDLSNAHEIWPDHWEDLRGQRRRIDGTIAGTRVALPSYPADLNACAEFEKSLTDEEHLRYRVRLWNVVITEGDETTWDRQFISATARQRCLAYLKTKGLIP